MLLEALDEGDVGWVSPQGRLVQEFGDSSWLRLSAFQFLRLVIANAHTETKVG